MTKQTAESPPVVEPAKPPRRIQDVAAELGLDPGTILPYGHYIAKTPASLSDSAKLRGRPQNSRITVNELQLSAGAGFVVAKCGNIVTMTGLPKVPVAARIKVLPDGRAVGLA